MSLECPKCLCTVHSCNKQYESNNGAGFWTDQVYCNHLNTNAPPGSGCQATCSNPRHNKADYCPCLLTGCPGAPFPEGSILYTNKKFCDAQNQSLPGGCSAKCMDRSGNSAGICVGGGKYFDCSQFTTPQACTINTCTWSPTRQCLCNVSGCNNNSLNSIMWTNKTYCDSLANFSGCQASCDCTKKGF
jgi:hypothetical protein